MSHIPNSAMKHAAPAHHPDETDSAKPTRRSGLSGSLMALGGTLLVGAVAAVAVPLWRRRSDAEAATATRKPRAGKPAKQPAKSQAKNDGGKAAKSAEPASKASRRKPAAARKQAAS